MKFLQLFFKNQLTTKSYSNDLNDLTFLSFSPTTITAIPNKAIEISNKCSETSFLKILREEKREGEREGRDTCNK